MESTNGAMHFVSTIDSSQYDSRIAEMESKFSNFSKKVQQEGGNMDVVIQKLTQTAAAFGVGFSAVNIIKQVALTRGSFQQLEQSFQTLLGSEEQANDLMKQLVRTAATTPFDLQGIARGARQLLAYGVAADKVNEKITQLGDIASGMGLSIDYITTLYGTTISKAHMDTMDLKQFKGQGIAIDEAIAEVMEVQKERIPELITAGEVTGEIVEKAIDVLAGGQGKFAGMMANQSKSITGQISNIEDAVDSMFNEIGKNSEGLISGVLSDVQYIVDNYKEIGELLLEIASAYGAYKAVLAGVTAIQGVGARAEAIELGKLMKTQGSEHAIAMQELMTKQHLSEEEAKQVLQLREEAKERLKNLEVRAAELEAIEAKALAQQREAAATLSSIQNEINLRKMNAAAMEAEGKPLAANEELAKAAMLEQKAAVAQKQADIAATNLQAASQQRATHAKKLDTFQTQMQMAMDEAHTKTTGKLTIAREKLAQVMRATGLSALANPVVAVTAAVAALAVVTIRAARSMTEEEKAVQKVNEAHKEATADSIKEKIKLQELCDALEEAKGNEDEYAKSKEELLKFCDKYNPKLREEIQNMEDTKQIYNLAQEAVHSYYMQKAKDAALEEANTSYAKVQAEKMSVVSDIIEDWKKDAMKGLDEESAKEKAKEINGYFREIQKAMEEGQLRIYQGSDMKISIRGLSEKATTYLNEQAKWRQGILLDIRDASEDLNEAKSAYEAAVARANNVFGADNVDDTQTDEFKAAQERWEAARKAYSKMISTEFKGVTEDAKAAAKKEYEEAKKAFKALGGNPVSVWANEQYEDAKRAWEDALAKKESLLAQVRAGKSVGDKILQNAIADEKTKKEAFEKLGGETSTKTAQNAAKKRAEERKKLEEEQARVLLEASRSSGKLIENAVEKELSNIQTTYEDNVKKIVDQRKKLEDAKNNKIISEKEFKKLNDELSAYDAIGGIYDQQRGQQIRQYFKRQIDAANTIGLNGHAKYEQQKTKISEEWANKRAELEIIANSKIATEAQKQAAENAKKRTYVQERADLAKVDLDEFKDSDYYKNVFGDLQNYGETTIKAMIERLQEFGSKLKDSMSAADIKAFEDAMQSLQMRMIEIDPFGAWKQASEELDKALKRKSEAYANLTEAQQNYNDAKKAAAKAELLFGKNSEEANDALLDQRFYEDMLTESTEEYAKAEDDAAKAENKVKKARNVALDSIDQLAGALDNVGQQVGGMFGDITNAIGSIVNLVQVSAQAMELTSSTATGVLKAIETASVILAIIGAVMQAMQALQKVFGGDKGRDDYNEVVEKQREINKLTDSVNEYQQAVLAAELAEKNWFSSGGATQNMQDQWKMATAAQTAYYEKAEQLQVKYQDRKAGRTGLGKITEDLFKNPLKSIAMLTDPTVGSYYLTKNTFAGDGNKYATTMVEAIDNLRFETRARKHGTWFRSGHAQETTDLRAWAKEHYGSDLINEKTGMVDVKMAESILKDYGDKLVGDTKETLEKLKEQAEAYEEAVKAIKDSTSDLFAPMVDNMTDAVWAWFTEGKDAMSEFEDLANDTFISIAKDMTKTLTNRLIFQDFSKSLEGIAEQYARGELREEQFMEQAINLVDNTIDQSADKIKSIQSALEYMQDKALEKGLDLTKTSEEQKAKYGGYETMSEQTGTELSGRFSAMYIVQSEQLGAARQLLAAMQSSLSVSTAHNGVLEDIRALQVVSNDYLATIAKSARAVAAWEESIGNIEKYTKSLYQ